MKSLKIKTSILSWIIPNLVKRVYLLATIYGCVVARMKLEPLLTEKRLDAFNLQFKLCKYTRSLFTLSTLGNNIWKTLPDPPLTEDKIASFVVSFKDILPAWLLYDNETHVMNEVTDVLKYVYATEEHKELEQNALSGTVCA